MNVIKLIIGWLIPNTCIVCGETLSCTRSTGSAILPEPPLELPCCDNCYQNLPFQMHCCQQCGQLYTAETDFCGRCIAKPPIFDSCFCPFRYEPPISLHIQKFKYKERPELAKQLALLLSNEILSNQLAMPDILIPVPMHPRKLRSRGYNQSQLIAKELSQLLKIPYSNELIEKHQITPSQASLSLNQRQANVHGSFRYINTSKPSKHAAIIDDVFTTGSTAAEIAKILKRNGVDYVQVWGIAHTI